MIEVAQFPISVILITSREYLDIAFRLEAPESNELDHI